MIGSWSTFAGILTDMELAGTGHRPKKLGGYSQEIEDRLYLMAFDYLEALKPDHVHVGMALGWDMALTYAAYDLGIPYTAHIPFAGQEAKWLPQQQDTYFEMVDRADTVLIYAPSFSFAAFFERDRGMVDCADHLVAMWDGAPNGGTFQTVRYATRMGVPIDNLWKEWAKIWGIPLSSGQTAQRISRTRTDEPPSKKESSLRDWAGGSPRRRARGTSKET